MANPFSRRQEDDNAIDPGKLVEAKFTEFQSELDKKIVTKEEFASLADTIKAMNARELEREEKVRKEQEAAAAKNHSSQNYDPNAAFDEFALDPRAAMNKAVAPATKVALLALSKQTRAEVLEGKEYYHGEFKKKVDSMIESGTTDYQQMSNPGYILNCYRLIMAEYLEAGKLDEMKRKTALHGFSDSNSTGKPIDPNAKPTVELKGKSAFAAAQLGLSEDDIINAAKDGAIHGLEVIA